MTVQASHPQAPGPDGPDFEDLVVRYYEGLYRFAMSLTRAEDQAADLVQETFLTWAAKGHQLRDAARARSWLFTILHRKFLETVRRGARFSPVDLEEAVAELPAAGPGVADQLDGRRLVELLSHLDPAFRAAVSLFYLEDLSHEEIAGVLEVPVGTVKSRISRGVAQLRALVGAEAGQTRRKEAP